MDTMPHVVAIFLLKYFTFPKKNHNNNKETKKERIYL